ncbi:MAG TPA: choice-of-anchor D domain-containing protein [Vicinamibacterales bacterium]|jgi:HYDIN/CFA65/VesB-like, Ig-like domain|nr:choice-of-anchor D domain-containing protein [Vicinamibacterales bacterium]
MRPSGDPRNRACRALLVLALLVMARSVQAQQVTLVNMIPNSLSGESNRDAEPNLAVNPANPLQIMGSAFTPDPLGTANLPLFVSTDGGLTWNLSAAIVPGTAGSCFTAICDITIRFASTSNLLYVSDLNPVGGISQLDIWRVSNPTTAAAATLLQSRPGNGSGFADQPYVEAASAAGTDRVFVANNDLMAAGGRTATIDHTANATPPPPSGFANLVIETRATTGQDSPSVRPAVHRDGTVYAIYAAFRAGGTEVVVARDDNWGTGGTPFQALIDTDAQPGIRVVSGLTGTNSVGSQRVGTGLAIAVDPRNSQNVYIVYGEGSTSPTYTLHVRNSTTRGTAWSGDLFTVAAATNPGIAVTSNGEVGFLYQQANNGRFETHLVRTSNNFITTSDLLLANVPDNAGSYTGANPIGDYASLIAVDTDFYGIFSANNTPNTANFAPGVVFLRNHNFATQTLTDLANNPVPVSIDPFFFHVGCCPPQIQIPGPLVFPNTCVGTSSTLTANVCNTGKKDLIVSPITSSNPQFSVATPSSGYPVTIAPGACFPFQVTFTPTSPGPQTGTLTVPSNDPITPSAQIAVSGTGGSSAIATIITDTGDFGSVCEGKFKDLPLFIHNNGTCPLIVTNVVSSSPEFQTAQVLAFPLTVAPGTSVEIPIRFQPTTDGNKTATITITSNDPVSPAKTVQVKGTTPPDYVCHPQSFAVVGANLGPTFGSSATGDFTFSGYGRYLAPFGTRKTYGVQAQGEYLYYTERQEGQFDAGLLTRFAWAQAGAFANFKQARLDGYRSGAGLGQAALTLDFLFLPNVRFGVFGTIGFLDRGVTEPNTTPLPPLQPYLNIVDQFGGSAQVKLPGNNYLEGNLEWLNRHSPVFGDTAGLMVRFVHQWQELGFTVEFDVNETLVGPTTNGRLVFGVQLGHWPRPSDLRNRRNPLGTDVPRLHYEILERPR